MLITIHEGTHKFSHIVLKANVNTSILKSILDEFVKSGHAETRRVSSARKEYWLTEQGHELVDRIAAVREAVSPVTMTQA